MSWYTFEPIPQVLVDHWRKATVDEQGGEDVVEQLDQHGGTTESKYVP